MTEMVARIGEVGPASAAAARANGPDRASAWSMPARVGFRWLFSYVVLYMLQPSPFDFLAPGLVAPYSALWERIVKWVGRHPLGLEITVLPNASGDTTYNYVQVLCYAVVAALVAVVWSVADRRRQDYRRLNEWLRAAVRLYLAFFMLLYGAQKVIKVQFADLSPIVLDLPVGELSPNALMWTVMGASTAYTFYSGLLEMLAGLLLVARRTTLLGALLCIGVMSHVVVLNLSYDVVVKLFSLHLLALAVWVAAPEARRLLDFFVRNRVVAAAELRPLFTSPRAHRIALTLRTLALAGLAAALVARAVANQRMLEEEVRRTPLYGTWRVEALTLDSGPQPVAAGGEAWLRLVFDTRHRAAVQLASGDWRRYSWHLAGRSLELGEGPEARTAAALEVRRRGPSRVELAGEVDGRPVTAVLHRVEPRHRLLSVGFRWINEGPRM